jgi:Putative prokaryotic signal transducing protein
MSEIDSEQERRRLTALYSQMTEGELQEIAAQASTLTEVAQTSLSDEFQRRGMPPVAEVARVTHEFEFQDLVTLRQFRDLPEAILARGVLESAGIESFLADDNIVRMDWFISNLIGGIKLKVRKEDLEAANEVLQEPAPGELPPENSDL